MLETKEFLTNLKNRKNLGKKISWIWESKLNLLSFIYGKIFLIIIKDLGIRKDKDFEREENECEKK